MRDSSVNILFQLLRAALGNEAAVGELSSDIDWKEVIDLSFDQGVAAIAVDGLGFAHDNENLNLNLNRLPVWRRGDEIAVRRLGFERGIFGIPEEFADFGASDAALVDRVLEEILHPTRVEGGRGCLPVYVWRRFRQWWLSRWKHRIVYSDSLVSTFLWQVRSHLMKPATLIGK